MTFYSELRPLFWRCDAGEWTTVRKSVCQWYVARWCKRGKLDTGCPVPRDIAIRQDKWDCHYNRGPWEEKMAWTKDTAMRTYMDSTIFVDLYMHSTWADTRVTALADEQVHFTHEPTNSRDSDDNSSKNITQTEWSVLSSRSKREQRASS